jgi:acyl carrier protein
MHDWLGKVFSQHGNKLQALHHLRLLAQYFSINTMQDNLKPTVSSTADLQREVAQLMIESLNLEVTADQITPDDPLYGDGLGLDSIDVLEVALVVSKRYGLQLRSDSEDNQHIFSSLRSLCDYIAAQRTL